MEGMKMAILMVDYENVWGTNGLKGVEYLTSEDVLYIFYSQCCEKIRAEYMEAIRNWTGTCKVSPEKSFPPKVREYIV